MEMLYSLKSYYKQNQRSKVLANRFLLFLTVTYVIASILIVLTNNNRLHSFIIGVLGIDYLITGPLILLFIALYHFLLLDNQFLGITSLIILYLNMMVSTFGVVAAIVWKFSENLFPYADSIVLVESMDWPRLIIYMAFLLFLLLFFLINRFNHKLKNYSYEKTYEVNHAMVFSSMMLPLLFLHFIGNQLRSLYVILA